MHKMYIFIVTSCGHIHVFEKEKFTAFSFHALINIYILIMYSWLLMVI